MKDILFCKGIPAKYFLLHVLFAGVLISCSQEYMNTDTSSARAKYLPPDQKILVFIGQSATDVGGDIYPIESFGPEHVDPNDPHGYGYINKMVEEGGAPMPGGITTYFFFELIDEEPVLTMGSDWLDLVIGRSIFDNTAFHISLGISNVNSEVASGAFDDAIRQLGAKISSYNRPVFLRIGYEFDNIGHGNNDPVLFQASWRRIIDILREENVDNFATVFSSIFILESVPLLTNCSPDNPLDCYPHEAYYPGDDYVDWMGSSFWFGPVSILPDRCMDMLNFARKRSKPVLLAETAPLLSDLKLDWLQDIFLMRFRLYFEFMEKNRDVIKAVHYINNHWQINPFWSEVPIYIWFSVMDTRLHINDAVKTLWLEKMAKTDIYLNAHERLFEELGY